MKINFALLIIFFPILVFGKVIAQVNNIEITEQQLQARLQEIDHSYPYLQAKNIALNKLINEAALLQYAEDNRINVSQQEAEKFFISQFSSHPNLQTEGIFDYDKFTELKNSENGKKIFKNLKKDLLLTKTESMIKSEFTISDDKLLEKFVLDNVKIDINYALLDKSTIAVPTTYTPNKAYQFYQENLKKFEQDETFNLTFHIIDKKTFQDSAKKVIEKRILNFSDSLVTFTNADSLQNQFFYQIRDSLALYDAERKKKKWIEDEVDFSTFSTGYLTDKIMFSPFFRDNNLLSHIHSSSKDGISILNSADFITLFKKETLSAKRPLDFNNDAEEIWNIFVKEERKKTLADSADIFYKKNFEDFIVPAAIVTKIEIPVAKSSTDFKKKIIDNIFDEKRLNKLIKENKLNKYNEIIYLERYSNNNINETIAKIIHNDQNFGILEENELDIVFRYSTLFPEYIPPFEVVEDLILAEHDFTTVDTTGFKSYFDDHIDQFTTTDSIKIGGVFVPMITDTLSIDSSEIESFYNQNKSSFIHEKAVQFDYIFNEDNKLITHLYSQINERNFDSMKLLFNQKELFSSTEIVEYDTLPDTINSALQNNLTDMIISPIAYEDGWCILWKKKDFKAGLSTFEEVEQTIEANLKHQKANSIAYQTAKTIFDSTRYFSHCYTYAPHEWIFKTSFLPIDANFEVIGEVPDKKEFKRMWINEKYSSIMEYDQGYAVLFLLKKIPHKKKDFKESIPELEKIFKENKRDEMAFNYALFLREQLQNDANADSIFRFFGGWKQRNKLSLHSKIQGIQYSKLILEDMTKREENYLSPVLKISDDKLFLYQINKIKKIPKSLFYQKKEMYQNKIVEEKYNDWLTKFKSTLTIKKY